MKRALKRLEKKYGPQGWWPRLVVDRETWIVKHGAKPSECFIRNKSGRAFEVAIGAILTQNTAWKNVEQALICLAEKNLLMPQAIANAHPSTLASCIRSAGYFRQKTKKLKIFSRIVLDECSGDLTRLVRRYPLNAIRSKLLSVWGIGPETADTILLYGLDQPVFVVDAYTRRWLVHLTKKKKWLQAPYEEVQELFEKALAGPAAAAPRPCSKDLRASKVSASASPARVKQEKMRIFQQSHALIVRWGKEKSRRT